MDKTTKNVFYILLASGGLAVLLWCFGTGISGNDFWWHIKAGEWICANGHVPDRDIFSWYGTAHGFVWVSHEWLSEVIYWLLFRWAGEAGVFLFSLGGAALMALLLAWRIRPYATENGIVTALYLSMFCVLASLFFYGRPHVFSYFLLYGELWCLYEYAEGKRGWCLNLIPVLAVLWSNLHGGSSNLSYLLVLLLLLCGSREWHVGRLYSVRWSRSQMFHLLAVLAATVCGIGINPAGYTMLRYPYICMADPVAMGVISEWTSPDAKNIGELILYFLPVLAVSFGLLFGKCAVRVWDAVLMLLFLLLFFRSVRFIALLYITAAFWAFPYEMPCRLKKIKKPLEKGLLVGAEILLLAAVCMGINNCVGTLRQGESIVSILDKQFVELLREDAPERLYNDYNYGGDLIFANIPVFIDGRADVYAQDNLLAESVSLLLLQPAGSGSPDMEALTDRYGFDAFLIGKDRPLYCYLSSNRERYELVLETEETAYFRLREQESIQE